MELNKSDRNYIILILVVLISVLSMKIRPMGFRLILKALVLLTLLIFIYKRDLKISLFLTLLLFSLNQNGIGNSVDFFQGNQVEQTIEMIPTGLLKNCYLRCYEDETRELEYCDEFCEDICRVRCSQNLEKGSPIIECNEMCDAGNQENFQNENENENENDNENSEPTTTQRQPLKSDERKCRIKCIENDYMFDECKTFCEDKCVNTCTSGTSDFKACRATCLNITPS